MCLSFAVFVFSHFWHLGWGPLGHDWVVVVTYYYAIETGLISLSLTCFLFERGPEQESMSTRYLVLQVTPSELIILRPSQGLDHDGPDHDHRSTLKHIYDLQVQPKFNLKIGDSTEPQTNFESQLQASHGSRVKGFFSRLPTHLVLDHICLDLDILQVHCQQIRACRICCRLFWRRPRHEHMIGLWVVGLSV